MHHAHDSSTLPGSFSATRPGLTVRVTVGNGRVGVLLTGELDLDTAPFAEDVVGRVLGDGGPRLEVDLLGVRFLGVAGLHALRRLQRRCLDAGGDLTVVAASPVAERAIGLAAPCLRPPTD